MNKLIKEYYNIIDRPKNCSYIALAEDSAKLSQDITIKFHKWCMNKPSLEYFKKEDVYFWKNKYYTQKELFELFINKYYDNKSNKL